MGLKKLIRVLVEVDSDRLIDELFQHLFKRMSFRLFIVFLPLLLSFRFSC